MSFSGKYSESVALYSSTRLPIKAICEQTDVPFSAFCNYLCRNHRDLILKRHQLDGRRNVRLRGSKGQTTAAHLKYRDAIEAAGSLDYIEYNISQVARIFGLDGTALGNQLRHHYPDIIPNREKERRRLGIADNIHHGVRQRCKDSYAAAVELLRDTDMTVEDAARECGVPLRGLREHIACYHKDLVGIREEKRRQAMRCEKVRGQRTGAWKIHEPAEAITQKYEEAVELYRSTSMSIEDIAQKLDLNKISLRGHIRQWHPELIVQRRGYDKGTKLSDTRRYRKATSEKYAPAIEMLKRNSALPTSAVARQFGLNPEVFRMYLKEHEPELAGDRGMTKTESGKRVGVKSSEKYAEALKIYSTSTETLKSIAERLGLVYISLGNYIRRNFPELIEQHNSLVESMSVSEKKSGTSGF